jgi:hypothetical protein
LARWIIDPDNPLAARVAANHIWQRHFGQAIVESMFDFGNNGRPPTHPALLDWLAAELMQPSWRLETSESGSQWKQTGDAAPAWSMKHLHRLIVTSGTYRMASSHDPQNAAIDPDNHYLWHMPSRRMEAELVRDGVLYVSGRLDQTMGGPELDQNEGLAIHRRSIYFRHAQEKQMPFLKIFDTAAVTECYQRKRKESIVPQQALAMMNSELTLASARELAWKLSDEFDANADSEFVSAAYETVLSRPAEEEEIAACVEFLTRQRALFEREAARLAHATGNPQDLSKPAAEPFLHARENLVQVLFNHNDFVTIH